MATKHFFDNEYVKIPGVRSRVVSGVRNPQSISSGNVLIIDTGKGATWGAGSGINGTFKQGLDAFEFYNNMDDFRFAMKGGINWLLGMPLFNPAGISNSLPRGVAGIYFIRGAATVPAELQITFTGDNDGSASTVNGGVFTVQARDEGLCGNGELATNGELKKGFAVKMKVGENDPNKFILQFFLGAYKGDDAENSNIPFNNIVEGASPGILLINSIEFDDINVLYSWMQTNISFNKLFKLVAGFTVSGTGAVDAADAADYADYILFAAGTETYSPTAFDDALAAAADLDISFIFSDQYGTSEDQSLYNEKYVNHITNVSRFKPELYIGSGSTPADFTHSKETCVFFDKDCVSVVHGGIKKAARVAQGFKVYGSHYMSASILGREAGIAPQVPITFKNIDIDGLVHRLTKKEIEQSLDAGLLTVHLDDGSFDVVKGINTLQANEFLLNEDGSTHSKQLKRIARQLNKEIQILAKKELLKDPNGVNRSTLSPSDLQKWVEAFLTRRMATPTSDNLILSWNNVTISRNVDAYYVNYAFVPNGEISFLFITGTIVEI